MTYQIMRIPQWIVRQSETLSKIIFLCSFPVCTHFDYICHYLNWLKKHIADLRYNSAFFASKVGSWNLIRFIVEIDFDFIINFQLI